jgi:hypothetical protein
VLQDPVSAVGLLAAVDPAHRRARRVGLFEVARAWIDGRTEVRLEQERRQTLTAILDQLPPGTEMIDRDAAGRVRIIRIPTCAVPAALVQGGRDR